MEGLSRLAYAISLFAVATAQYFPPIPENVNTIQSKFGNGVSISYKEACFELGLKRCIAFPTRGGIENHLLLTCAIT